MSRLITLARRTIRHFSDDGCTLMAAAISYYALFSIVPLTVLAVSVFGFVMQDEATRTRVIDGLVDTLPLGEDNNIVRETIDGVRNVSAPLGIVGLAIATWSASAMFGAIRRSFRLIWRPLHKRPFVRQKLVDFGMLLLLGLLAILSVVGTGLVRTLQAQDLGPLPEVRLGWDVLLYLVPALLSFAAFLLLYRYVPHVSIGFRDVWPGAALATVLFEIVKNTFALYVANFGRYDIVYGALGGVLLFLTWTYLSANILLLGAELAAQYVEMRDEPHVGRRGPAEPLGRRALRFLRGLIFTEKRQ